MTRNSVDRNRLGTMQRIGDGGGIKVVSTQDGARMKTPISKRDAAKGAVDKASKQRKAELLAAIAKRRPGGK